MRHHRGHRIRRARQLRRARNCLPGQSGADVRGRNRQGRHQPDRPDAGRRQAGRRQAGRRQAGCRPVDAAPLKCAACGTIVSWPNRKAAASQTCPVRWPISRPLDARTGLSVPLAHDEPGIDRQRVFGGLCEKRVTLLVTSRVRCLVSGDSAWVWQPPSSSRPGLPGLARAGWTPTVKSAGKRCAGRTACTYGLTGGDPETGHSRRPRQSWTLPALTSRGAVSSY
jgi:hypothetical protein